MKVDLRGKTALVCGSTQGIGRAAATELAASGARIVLMARSEEALKTVACELPTPCDQNHTYVVADFSDPDEVKHAITKFLENGGPVHILVNNTGGPAPGTTLNATLQEFTAAFSQHLLCNHILVQAVVDGMQKEKFGRIINVISTSVKQPIPGLGVSNSIRGSVANWAKTLAGELGADGITVNNILPGPTATGRMDQILQNNAEKSGKSIEEVTEKTLSTVPIGRLVKPEEVGAAITFLASPEAAAITGINLPVDGGRTNSL